MSLYQFKDGDQVILAEPSSKTGKKGVLVAWTSNGRSGFYVRLYNWGNSLWAFLPERDKLDPISRSPLWEALS